MFISTEQGFYANFNYISGTNAQHVKIPMTAPVLSRSINSSSWDISFYTPASLYPTLASVPVPTAPGMSIDAFPSGGVLLATVGFGGFATETEFVSTAAKLRAALTRDGRTLVQGGPFTESWAQYDSPSVIFVSTGIYRNASSSALHDRAPISFHKFMLQKS